MKNCRGWWARRGPGSAYLCSAFITSGRLKLKQNTFSSSRKRSSTLNLPRSPKSEQKRLVQTTRNEDDEERKRLNLSSSLRHLRFLWFVPAVPMLSASI